MAIKAQLKVQPRKTDLPRASTRPLTQKPSNNVPQASSSQSSPDSIKSSLPFKKRAILLPYEKDVKDPTPVQEEPLDLSNGYKCNQCPKTFKGQDRLKAHQRRHEVKKSGRYTCDVCDKPFVQQSSLITHKRIHTGEKPFHCPECKNSYGDLSTFTKHIRTHTGDKPYECNYCHQKFSQSGNCLRHKRSVHADRHLDLATKS